MARKQKSLILRGFLRIGGKKYEAEIQPRLGGEYLLGMLIIDVRASAPGGFETISIQIAVVDFKWWLVKCQRWIRKVRSWKEYLKDQKEEAKEILSEISLEQL